VHGNGTHMDNFETHDERHLIPHTGFSIEPASISKATSASAAKSMFTSTAPRPSSPAPAQKDIIPILALPKSSTRALLVGGSPNPAGLDGSSRRVGDSSLQPPLNDKSAPALAASRTRAAHPPTPMLALLTLAVLPAFDLAAYEKAALVNKRGRPRRRGETLTARATRRARRLHDFSSMATTGARPEDPPRLTSRRMA